MATIPTIHDVARAADVSPATVSRVINNTGPVNSKTRERVMAAVKQMHYQPNHFSRKLRLKESRMILVLLIDFVNPFYGEIITGMDDAAQKLGYNIMLAATYSNSRRETRLISRLDEKLVDGVIFTAPTISLKTLQSLDSRFPVVQCTEYLPEAAATHVSIDNLEAAYQVMQYLIQLGHKRIGMISSSNGFISTIKREQAYIDALRDNDIPFDKALLLRGNNYTFESGAINAREMLNMKNRPTAIFAISDTVAAGCIRTLGDAGLRIPDDMAVFGFDNIELARMTTPPLSTVAQPLKMLGMTAVELLISKLRGYKTNNEVFLPHEIVTRKSTMRL